MTETTDKLDELMEDFDTAMLVTESLQGDLRARPMAVAEHTDNGVLYFATRAAAAKLEEILRSQKVAVTMQGDGVYLSISGTAKILVDQVLADELWSAPMRLWFPDGHDDPDLVILVVEPDYAEYWDRTGASRLEYWWEAGKALAKGERVEDDNLSGHEKMKL